MYVHICVWCEGMEELNLLTPVVSCVLASVGQNLCFTALLCDSLNMEKFRKLL